ncbi:upf0764 protein c16orf89-like protein, partial [Plakobranchus ocellatus]
MAAFIRPSPIVNTMKTTLIVLLVLCFLSFRYASSYARNDADMQQLLHALEKLLNFFQKDYRHLNLDGFFGLRVLEGQLQLLISEHSVGGHQHLSSHTLNQITALKEAAQNLSAIGLSEVKKGNPEYYKNMAPVIAQPWMVRKPHRRLDPSLRWEIPLYKAQLQFVRRNFTEKVSDQCMTEIFNSDSERCDISKYCVRLMTSRGLTGYPITHQLLWSVLVEDR